MSDYVKRRICTACSAVLLILACGALFGCSKSAHADDIPADPLADVSVELIACGDTPAPRLPAKFSYMAADNGNRDAYSALYDALLGMNTELDLSRFQIDKQTFGILFADVVNHSPELFYISPNCKIGLNSSTMFISKVYFEYTMSIDDASAALAFFNESINEIFSKLPDGMNDFDRALWFHDYICTFFEYDTQMKNYDAYTFLRDKKGVCQSYTLLYMALMQRSGINVDYSVSDDMNHIWNVVELGGSWYHVDVTWDDPLSASSNNDMPGIAKHDSFMCSDAALMASGHYNWVARQCSSTLYDGKQLDAIAAPLAYLDGVWYAVDRQDGSVRTITFPDMTTSEVFPISGVWYRWNESGAYIYHYSNICTLNNKLYFSTPSAIGEYDPVTRAVALKHQYTEGEGYIYKLYADGDMLTYGIATSPDSRLVKSITIDPELEPPTPPPPPDLPAGITYPDLNCGTDAASTLATLSSGQDGSKLRLVMISSLEQLSWYSAPAFNVSFYNGDHLVNEHKMSGDDLIFSRVLVDIETGDRFIAADGYCMFGLAVNSVPDDTWTHVRLSLTDQRTETILFDSTINNANTVDMPQINGSAWGIQPVLPPLEEV